jgi:phage terminase large subunit-like protein
MRHFDAYAELVESGGIAAGKLAKLAIKRVQRYKTQYTFKQSEADRRIAFIEAETCQTKGGAAPLKLALPQKAWLETVWGFYHDVAVARTDPTTMREYEAVEERRLINECAIIVARGSGKTTLAAAIAFVGLLVDGEHGADVQLLAYDREQAGYIFNANRAMLRNDSGLIGLLRRQEMLKSTKRGILYEPTNSLLSIKTSDYESLDGTNAHYNVFDEVHTYDEDFIQVVNDGSSRKRKNWITWYLSTCGTKRGKIFDKYMESWEGVLRGEIDNDSIMPFIYKIDAVEEARSPAMWPKAMPMLGIITGKEAVAKDIEMSKDDPAKQAELLAKTFNWPVDNYLAFFSNEECLGNRRAFNPMRFQGDALRRARCVVGLDLSDVNDICAAAVMIPDGDVMQFKLLSFVPRSTVGKLAKEQRDQYLEWESRGYLRVHEMDFNDPAYIFGEIQSFMEGNMAYPVAVGYDRWGAAPIKREFENYYGDITHPVEQTVKGLSPHLKVYKSKLAAGKIAFDDPLATWCHANVKVRIDGNGNIFPNKAKASAKIDVFAAMLDAYACYENNKADLAGYFDDGMDGGGPNGDT